MCPPLFDPTSYSSHAANECAFETQVLGIHQVHGSCSESEIESLPAALRPAEGESQSSSPQEMRFHENFFFFSFSFFYIYISYRLFPSVVFFFNSIILIYLSIIRQIPYVESFESDGSNVAVVDLLIILLSNIGGAFEQAYREDRKLHTVRSIVDQKKRKRKNGNLATQQDPGVFLNFSFMV